MKITFLFGSKIILLIYKQVVLYMSLYVFFSLSLLFLNRVTIFLTMSSRKVSELKNKTLLKEATTTKIAHFLLL